ncbi:MAG TPA: hypothetical protein VMW37_02275 [Dehalococcoidales bacterium]|nr:hypothetical protein [Dehalococcoidales bacterium]
MPKKSRRFKALQSKRKKIRQQPLATAAQQPVVTQTDKPVASAPLASAPARKTASDTVRYPFVVAELLRIGVLAGIILVILIVLALVLS